MASRDNLYETIEAPQFVDFLTDGSAMCEKDCEMYFEKKSREALGQEKQTEENGKKWFFDEKEKGDHFKTETIWEKPKRILPPQRQAQQPKQPKQPQQQQQQQQQRQQQLRQRQEQQRQMQERRQQQEQRRQELRRLEEQRLEQQRQVQERRRQEQEQHRQEQLRQLQLQREERLRQERQRQEQRQRQRQEQLQRQRQMTEFNTNKRKMTITESNEKWQSWEEQKQRWIESRKKKTSSMASCRYAPKEFSTLPIHNNKNNYNKNYFHSATKHVTVPISPALNTSKRAQIKAQHHNEQQHQWGYNANSMPYVNRRHENRSEFKARKLNKKIFESDGFLGIQMIKSKEPTIPQSFTLNTAIVGEKRNRQKLNRTTVKSSPYPFF